MTEIEQLTAMIKAQQESIAALAEHVGALVQCVAMLLGEEMGTPMAENPAPAVETDWDGNPIG